MIMGNASLTMGYNTCRFVEIAIFSWLPSLQVIEQSVQEVIALAALA